MPAENALPASPQDAQDKFLAKHPKLKSFTDKHPEWYKFFKWLLAGQLSTVVESGVFYVLQFWVFASILNKAWGIDPDSMFGQLLKLMNLDKGVGYFWAYFISIAVGYAIAYILNRKISFQSDANIAWSTFLYIIMVIFTMVVSAWLATAFQNWLNDQGDTWRAVGQIVVKPVQAMIPGIWTYPLNRFVIHRKKKAIDN
ncbi:MAG: GtrA family protein [Oscillospiraceae bacterium]|jgi:putative flippase GtrA|nr:GtrA family protein [Oscillospiraceae bacterium]